MRRCLALVFCALVAAGGFSIAQATGDDAYPTALPIDACGGAPGDPPIPSFEPGSVTPNFGPPGRLQRWVVSFRVNGPVLLTGTADPDENGYDPKLAWRRAEAVQENLTQLGVDVHDIWIRGADATNWNRLNNENIGGIVTIEQSLLLVKCITTFQTSRFAWYLRHCHANNANAPGCEQAVADLSQSK